MAAPKNDRGDVQRLSAEPAYQGLPAHVARVFRLLPMDPGPDVSAAAVAALAGIPSTEARAALRSLDRAGLVQAMTGGDTRWRIRDLARVYARRLSEAHAAPDEREVARDRLLRYYQTTTEAADGRLQGRPSIPVPEDFSDRDEALAWLDAERANLLAVTQMAAEVGRDHAAKSLPLLMAYYLGFRGYFDDLLVTTVIGLDAARRLEDLTGEGEALNNLGSALVGLGRCEEAFSRFRDAVAIFRQLGNRRAEAESSANLAISLTGLGRYDEALTAYQEGLAVLRLIGDQRAAGAALNNLGITLRALRRYDEACAVYQDAAAIFRETGDRHRLAMTLSNLGNVLRSLGRPADAVGIYQEAVGIFWETGDQFGGKAALEKLKAVQGTP
jgi:Tfp pilus assembly protein PilF